MTVSDLVAIYYGKITLVDKKGEEIIVRRTSNKSFFDDWKKFLKFAHVEISTVVEDEGYHILKVWMIEAWSEVVEKENEERKEEMKKYDRRIEAQFKRKRNKDKN